MTKNRAPLRSLVRGGGISYGIVQPGEHDPDGVPVVRVGDLAGGKLDGVAPVLRVTRSIEERFAKTRLTGGEVLVSVVGSVGTCALVPPSHAGWNVARAIAVLRPDVVEAR